MQELAAVLSGNPAAMQLAFVQTAAAYGSNTQMGQQQQQPCSHDDGVNNSSSSSQMLQQLPTQQQQRYSLVPIAALPQLLASAMPGWGGADVSFAALQIRCHMNIVTSFCIDTPKAAGCGSQRRSSCSRFDGCGSSAAASNGAAAALAANSAPAPTDMMYAELAATLVSAAATEAAAAAGELPPAVQQLVVDLADEVTSNAEAYARLQDAWQQQATLTAAAHRTAAAGSEPCTAGGEAVGGAASKLPVVAGVRLLCKQLVASVGLSDMRLLGWLTCLVRQQHLAMQLAALHEMSEAAGNGSPQQWQGYGHGVLVAELSLQELCEVLVQLVQALLTADDAAIVEEFKQHTHAPNSHHACSTLHEGAGHWGSADGMAAGAAAAAGIGAGTPEPAVPVQRQRIVFCGASSCSSSACSSPSWRAFGQQQQQHRGSSGADSLQHGADSVPLDVGYFQPMHCGSGCPAGPAGLGLGCLLDSSYHPEGAGSGLQPGDLSKAEDAGEYGSSCGHDGFRRTAEAATEAEAEVSTSEGGGRGISACMVPASLQQQRAQMQRLRAAQQQAWQAEMLLQHQPWEGAYSPVAAAARCGSSSCCSNSGGCGGAGYFGTAAAESAAVAVLKADGGAGAVEVVGKAKVVDILRLSSSDYRSSCGSDC
jgi:hypothetical protein